MVPPLLIVKPVDVAPVAVFACAIESFKSETSNVLSATATVASELKEVAVN